MIIYIMSTTNSRYIRISSYDKDPNQSRHNGDFTVELKEKYLTQSIHSMLLTQAFIPNVFYNVRSSQGVINNTIRILEAGQTELNISVDEGQYTLSELISELQTKINAQLVGSVLVITEDAKTKKLTFTFTGNAVTIYGHPDYSLTAGSLIADVIGIRNDSASSNAIIMDFIPNLRGYDQLFIHSNTICQGSMVDGNAGLISALVCVPMNDTPFGGMAYFHENLAENTIEYTQPCNMSVIKVVLRDSEGNRLDPGSSAIEFIMRVSF